MAFQRTVYITLTSIMASLAVVLRMIKHSMLGPIQVINLMAVITIITALILGAKSGGAVAIMSYIISDFFLGFGPWTLVNAFFLALVGLTVGFFWHKKPNPQTVEMMIILYMLLFLNDIATSTFGLNLWAGVPLDIAFVAGLVGLFLPASGGFLIAIGPVTEFSSALAATLLYPQIQKIVPEVII